MRMIFQTSRKLLKENRTLKDKEANITERSSRSNTKLKIVSIRFQKEILSTVHLKKQKEIGNAVL